MPELPEVETVARRLRASLPGRSIVNVEVLWNRTVTPSKPADFSRRLVGQTIIGVGRRGKWVRVDLNGGDVLLVHLRMTGQLMLRSAPATDERHLRVSFVLDDGRWLYFFDQRKFGRMVLTDDPQAVLGDLGPEPLAEDFTAARLGEMLAQRRGRIKPLLLNQRFLVGLGNIYADEALWRAGVHPLRAANTLDRAEVERLHEAIGSTLRAAIDEGGTTLSDTAYRQPDGQLGSFGGLLAVYGREGRPCPRCGDPIQRIRVNQRSAHVCLNCQRPPGEKL